MTVLITDGWLIIGDGTDSMRLMFEKCKIDWFMEPTIKHYAGGSHVGYTTGKRWLVFKVENIWLTSSSNFDTFTTYITSWQDDGPFDLEIYRDTSSNKITIDGNTDWDVMIQKNGLKDMQKIGFEDEDIYQIGLLILEEAG
jgi:hypothetical protein